MSDDFDKILYTSIIVYTITMICIIMMRPSFTYDDNNKKFKTFGTGKNETVLPIQFISPLLCIIVYIAVMLCNMITKKLL